MSVPSGNAPTAPHTGLFDNVEGGAQSTHASKDASGG
jgi:hypothetical protein